MQSKIVRTAERAAFELAADQFIRSASGKNREEAVERFLSLASKVIGGKVPGFVEGVHKALYPGSKWEQWLFRLVDETDPHVLKTFVMSGGYEGAFRGFSDTVENAERLDTNIQALHCLGDGSGWTRGLMMASVMGLVMGEYL